jgi:hypothetical protein
MFLHISLKKTRALIIGGFLLAASASAQYNNWAVGFQLIDPSGVNVRKYFNDKKAIDVSIGTYGLLYGRDRAYRKGNYENAGISLRANYLWHSSLFKQENLHGYYGFGGQVNSRRYYFDATNGSGRVYTNNISIGASGLAGLEYFIPSKPLSIFVETGLYVELIPAIFFLHPQASAGVRYNF